VEIEGSLSCSQEPTTLSYPELSMTYNCNLLLSKLPLMYMGSIPDGEVEFHFYLKIQVFKEGFLFSSLHKLDCNKTLKNFLEIKP
jgi:hypothetical protein